MRGFRLLRRVRVLGALSTVSVMAGACMVGPDYVRPSVEQPARFKSQAISEAGPPIPEKWWRLYREPELDRLIATATESNQTLRQAVARVDEARALAPVAGRFFFPTISTNPRFSRTRHSGDRGSTLTGQQGQQGVTVHDWLIPL